MPNSIVIRCLGRLLLIVGIFALGFGTVQAAKREYPTIIVLGQATPLDSSEGLTTPLVILDHESSGHFLNSTLRLKYETVSPTLSLTHRLGAALDFEYAVDGTALAEGNGTDLYLKGVRLKEKAFAGDGVSKRLGLHFFPTSPLRFSVTVDERHRKFYAAKDTPATYQFPAEFDERTTSGVVKWVGLLHEDGELSATTIQGKRSSAWKDWELDNHSETTATFSKTLIAWKDQIEWGKFAVTKLEAVSASGTNLDLFSGFKVGGLTSEYSVAGHFRNEYRARSVQVYKLWQEINFAEDRILYLFGDQATFLELDLSYLGNPTESRSISGAGVGFRYGIRSLKGLPIIVTYGEGSGVPETSKEQHRRELVVVIALGF